MASTVTTTALVSSGYTKSSSPCSHLSSTRATTFGAHRLAYPSGVDFSRRPKTSAVVRAEVQPINPEIRKTEAKVVDSVVVTELAKPLTAYCRCWRSGTFPLCDGSHVKHNKATGDNVGPLLLKKE
ncbi:putative Iron sulfur-containing domain, CDGSH-type [Rosa chinensis]|uniref:Putative Iron sulfur-containing domain, CDGSH-type n=1 Tax=Rosa chinensis TaxID=74649 RepID=A0A2P6SMK2_ROSCH|nr:CDGSH iron-sulfur domain-containing protein NEET [Rosa chinensis]PRQ59903.1 putative Iron sulfur-containing domain, CDGSH-type [Rosa chinensis]